MSATATPPQAPIRPPPTRPCGPRRPVAPPPRRGRLGWLVAGAGVVFLIVVAPVALLAGAGNPPQCDTGAGGPVGVNETGGPAPGGHFAAPLQLAPGSWYRIGATEYGPPGTGTHGSAPGEQGDLAIHPDSFAELSTLDDNPANVSPSAFTFADADALGTLPYGSNVRVHGPSGRELVLAKRDTGYGQGPGGQTGGVIYRMDIWNAVSPQLGVTKSPVSIELAPASGTGATLGQTPVSAPVPAPTAGIVNIGSDQAAGYVDALKPPQGAGFAVVSDDGSVLAQDSATILVPGGAVTEAMLLVAYLRHLHGPLTVGTKAQLVAMVGTADAHAADAVYRHVGPAAVNMVAQDAGMTRFRLRSGSAGYALAGSRVDALDQARLFSKIDALIPAAHRGWALALLTHPAGSSRWGVLDAKLPHARVTATAAGSTPTTSGWGTVQSAQLDLGAAVVGVAVTAYGNPSAAAGQTVIRTVADDLHPQVVAGASAQCTADGAIDSGALQLTPGQTAQINLQTGDASAPADAPVPVKRAIAAANQIHAKPYPDPDIHYGSLAQPWPAYDCSGSASYVLWKAGLHSVWPDVSGALENWGQPGPGKWITVYANSGHTWVVVAGLAFDTSNYGGPNIPAGSGPRWRQNPTGNLADGLQFVVRHPAGAWNQPS